MPFPRVAHAHAHAKSKSSSTCGRNVKEMYRNFVTGYHLNGPDIVIFSFFQTGTDWFAFFLCVLCPVFNDGCIFPQEYVEKLHDFLMDSEIFRGRMRVPQRKRRIQVTQDTQLR